MVMGEPLNMLSTIIIVHLILILTFVLSKSRCIADRVRSPAHLLPGSTTSASSAPARTLEATSFPPPGQGHPNTINLGATAATQTALPAAYSNKANDPNGTTQNQGSWESWLLAATATPAQPATVLPASYANNSRWTFDPAYTAEQPAYYGNNTSTSGWPLHPAYTTVPSYSHLSPSVPPPSSSPVWLSSSSQHGAMSPYPSRRSWRSVHSAPQTSSHNIWSPPMSAQYSMSSSSGITSNAPSSTRYGRSSSIGSRLNVSSLSSTGSSSASSSLRGSDRASHFVSKSRISSRVSSDSRMSADTSSRSTYYSQRSSDSSSCVSRCSSDLSYRYRG